MKKQFLLSLLVLMVITTSTQAQKGFDKIFTNQEWMQQHLDDDNLVILHVGNKKSYTDGHIKGAQLMTTNDFARVVGDLYWELHEESDFTETLRGFGINNKSQIVIVNGMDDHAAGFRLYFTLDYFGLAKITKILDGGMVGWKANKLTTTKEAFKAEATPEGDLKLKPNPAIKVDKDYVKANSLKDEINVIDARKPNFYQGTEETREHYQRSGHVPGAENICWLDIVDENQFMKSRETLLDFYQNAGVKKKEEVVAYCHVGLRASVIYTMAKALGYKVKLYDGSYNEWDTLSDDYPVKTGKDSK